MEFDFTSVIDRRGTNTLAVDVNPVEGSEIQAGFSRIPLWVADMSFATAPSVLRALRQRLEHPCFGYFVTPDAYYDAILGWQRDRNGAAELARECVGYENGVLGGLVSAVQAFSAPGDAVLLHAPAYIGFTGVLRNNGRRIVLSELRRDEQGVWRMDYDDMEEKLRAEHIHVAVFCSPHNPCGRVWERWEIEKAMALYARYDCVVLSDEIWSDIILPGHRHIPTQSVSDDARRRTVALYAVSKTFNLAGLVGAYHVIYDPYLRDRVEKQASLCHYNDANVLSVAALTGAYCDEGRRWVDELCRVLERNVSFAWDYFTRRCEGVSAARPEGTYMLYLDCEAWCRSRGMTLDELLRAGAAVGVLWQDGRPFGRDWTIRLNLALPFSLLGEALDRLDRHVFGGAGRAGA